MRIEIVAVRPLPGVAAVHDLNLCLHELPKLKTNMPWQSSLLLLALY